MIADLAMGEALFGTLFDIAVLAAILMAITGFRIYLTRRTLAPKATNSGRRPAVFDESLVWPDDVPVRRLASPGQRYAKPAPQSIVAKAAVSRSDSKYNPLRARILAGLLGALALSFPGPVIFAIYLFSSWLSGEDLIRVLIVTPMLVIIVLVNAAVGFVLVQPIVSVRLGYGRVTRVLAHLSAGVFAAYATYVWFAILSFGYVAIGGHAVPYALVAMVAAFVIAQPVLWAYARRHSGHSGNASAASTTSPQENGLGDANKGARPLAAALSVGSKEPNVDAIDPVTGQTALQTASYHGRLDEVRMLLGRGANVDAVSAIKRATPLHYAAEGGFAGIAALLVMHGADVNAGRDDLTPGGSGNTPLIIAAAEGHLDMVYFLLERGARADLANNEGSTPVFMAAQRNQREIVQCLLAAGANPDIPTTRGATPLHIAAERGFVEVAQMLISAGSQIDTPTVENGDSPLHDAVQNGHGTIVELLLQRGADANRVDRLGNTPLHVAAYGGHCRIVAQLLAHGASARVKNASGYSPAELTCDAEGADISQKAKILALINKKQAVPARPPDGSRGTLRRPRHTRRDTKSPTG